MPSWQTPTTLGTWVLRGEGFSILSCCGCCGCRAEGWFGGSLDLLGSQTRLLSGVMYCVAGVITQVWCFQYFPISVSNSQWNSHDIVTGIGTRTCLTAKPHSILSLDGPCYKLAMEYVDVWWCLDPKSIRSYQLPALGNINHDSPTWSRSNKMDESGHEIHRFTMIHHDSPTWIVGWFTKPFKAFERRSTEVRKSCVQDWTWWI